MRPRRRQSRRRETQTAVAAAVVALRIYLPFDPWFPGATLHAAELTEVSAPRASFAFADLSLLRVSGGDLTAANFAGADLTGAWFGEEVVVDDAAMLRAAGAEA